MEPTHNQHSDGRTRSYSEAELTAALQLQHQLLTKQFRRSRYIQVWLSAWFGFILTGLLVTSKVGSIALFIGPSVILLFIYAVDQTLEPLIRNQLRKMQEKEDANSNDEP